MATRMQQRRGTAAQWTSANPILNAGEMGWESDTNKFKIGDGTNHWADIDYFIDQSSTVNPSFGSSITFEGATANDYETTLAVTDPTADRTITLPNATGTVVLADGSGNVTVSGNLTVQGTTTTIDSSTIAVTNSFTFEGSSADDYETTLTVTDPTADRTITLPNVSGTVITTGNLSGTGATATELGYLAGVTSAIQTQLNNKQAVVADVSDTEIGYLNGVTSAIQTQLNDKAPKANPTFTGTVSLPSGTSIGDLSSTEIGYLEGVSAGIQGQIDGKAGTGHTHTLSAGATDVTASASEVNLIDGSIAATIVNSKAVIYGPAGEVNATTLQIAGTSITSTAAEINLIDGSSAGTIANSKAVIYGASGEVNATTLQIGGVSITSTAEELNILDGVTASTTELNYVDGVTSAIQTQLDAKAALSGATFVGAVSGTDLTLSGNLTVNGTTTNINSTNLVVEDKNVVLGDVTSPTDTTADGGGITLKGATDKTFNWVDATDSWTSSENINLASGKDLKVNGTAVISSTAGGFIFTDGTQTKEGVPSRTAIIQKTAEYTLSAANERDSLIEVSHTGGTAVKVLIPTDATFNFPIGTSIDILRTNTGAVTIEAVTPGTTTVNATPGLKLRAQWSSATLFKRAANLWVVMGDLSA
jgi:hypothetical protein